jgi:hypothetical protein
MSAHCLRAARVAGSNLNSRYQGLGARENSRRLALDDFELWRPRVAAWLAVAAGLLAPYWVAWFADRNVVASAHTPEYVAFEQAFPLADAWLAGAALLAAVTLLRRLPSALIWPVAVGGAALYLGALDILYDLQHGIYAKGSGGAIELGINLVTVVSGIGVMRFAWRFRNQLLETLVNDR